MLHGFYSGSAVQVKPLNLSGPPEKPKTILVCAYIYMYMCANTDRSYDNIIQCIDML